MRALEAIGLVLGILASLVVVLGCPSVIAVSRLIRGAAEDRRRREEATEDLIAAHGWPGQPPPTGHLSIERKEQSHAAR